MASAQSGEREPASLANESYWSGLWEGAAAGSAWSSRAPGLRNTVVRRHCEYLSRFIPPVASGGMIPKLLEVGCAASQSMPFFAGELGLEVAGIDYSEIGCQRAESILSLHGVCATVYCADFFHPPPELLDSFDFVVSFGVVEHFPDTALCLAAMAKFLKPGGAIITNVPNLTGLIGQIQKLLNRPVYDLHVVLSPEDLSAAHRRANLEVEECGYFLATNFGVLNANGLRKNSLRAWFARICMAVLFRFSAALWFLEEKTGFRFSPTAMFAPYIHSVGRKRAPSIQEA